MGIRSFAKRLTTPVSDLDSASLRDFCAEHVECQKISEVVAREEASVVGEISSVRIVPHNGQPWLVASISDGTGYIEVMWTGRREIAGVTPGKRLVVSGRFAPARPGGKTMKLMNPAYELLPKVS
jgi:RecG-like helicase